MSISSFYRSISEADFSSSGSRKLSFDLLSSLFLDFRLLCKVKTSNCQGDKSAFRIGENSVPYCLQNMNLNLTF